MTTPFEKAGAMTDPEPTEVRSEGWIVDAGRELDPPQSDIERLTRSVIDSARKMSHSRTALATDIDRVIITDRVLRRLLLIDIRRQMKRPVLEVVVDSSAGEVDAIRLGIVCWYDDVLDDLADRTRSAIAEVLTGALGAERGARAADLVDIDWVDLDEQRYRPGNTSKN